MYARTVRHIGIWVKRQGETYTHTTHFAMWKNTPTVCSHTSWACDRRLQTAPHYARTPHSTVSRSHLGPRSQNERTNSGPFPRDGCIEAQRLIAVQCSADSERP